jgi:hypothetical protein
MALPPEQTANIDRFFGTMKSLNEFDKLEIRNVVGGILFPSAKEQFLTLNYHRAVINIELLLTIKDALQFQAITMFARATLELSMEVRLIGTVADAVEKIMLFTEVEKLKAAKKVVEFKRCHRAAKTALSRNSWKR